MLRRQAQRYFQSTIRGKNSVDDPYETSFTPEIASRFQFSFPLKPQSKAVALAPDLTKVVQPEVAVRYLENIGVTPSASNLKLVMPHVSVGKTCKMSAAFKARGWLTDVLHVTPHWAVKDGKSFNAASSEGIEDKRLGTGKTFGSSTQSRFSTGHMSSRLSTKRETRTPPRELYRCKNVKDWVLEDILRVFVFPHNMQNIANEYHPPKTNAPHQGQSSYSKANASNIQHVHSDEVGEAVDVTVLEHACKELLLPLQTTRSSIVHVIKDSLTQLHVSSSTSLWRVAMCDESVRVVGLIAHFLYWELLSPSLGSLRDNLELRMQTTSAKTTSTSTSKGSSLKRGLTHSSGTRLTEARNNEATSADAGIKQPPKLTRHERESIFVVINQLLQTLLCHRANEDTSFHLLCIRVSVLRVIGRTYPSTLRVLSRPNGIEAFFELDSAVLSLVDPEQLHTHVPTLVSSLDAVKLTADSPRRRRQRDLSGNPFQPSRISGDRPLQHAFFVTSPLITRLYGRNGAEAASAEIRQMYAQRAKHDPRQHRRQKNKAQNVSKHSSRQLILPGEEVRKVDKPGGVELPIWAILQANRLSLFDTLTGDALLLKSRNALYRMAADNVPLHFDEEDG
jgi:hypothetical protein